MTCSSAFKESVESYGKENLVTFSYLELQVANNRSTFLCSLSLLEHQLSLLTLACGFLCWEETTGNCALGWRISWGHLPVWHLCDLLSLYLDFSEVGKRQAYLFYLLLWKKAPLNSRLKTYLVLLFSQNCKARCLHPHRKCAPSLQIPHIIHCWNCCWKASGILFAKLKFLVWVLAVVQSIGTAESLCCTVSCHSFCSTTQWEISQLWYVMSNSASHWIRQSHGARWPCPGMSQCFCTNTVLILLHLYACLI